MRHGEPLYRAEQVRELDRRAIEKHGIAGIELMERAGRAVFDRIGAMWPEAGSLSICCGGGNNGGDGYIVATLARSAGWRVQLIALKPPQRLSGSAALAAQRWLAAGGRVEPPETPPTGAVIVDALLGTGLDRPASGQYADLIEAMNRSGRPIVAVDLPSGLNADTGMPVGRCVEAAATVSFIGRKRGLYTGQAGRFCGRRFFDGLGLPEAVFADYPADAVVLDAGRLPRVLPSRAPDTHKGMLGHVVVVGGAQGMEGAAGLAGAAALRCGSGLVTLVVAGQAAIAAIQAELMVQSVSEATDLDPFLARAQCVAVGPGLGQSQQSAAWFARAWARTGPLVVDADALNLLARSPRPREQTILTPHPGEAARLLGCDVAAVQSDRFAAARSLAERFAATVVLKGWGSLVAAADGRAAVCPYGGPAMASAGMGDALTGVIASLYGQGLAAFDAACVGVLIHALAGDRAARGRRQILASDLIGSLAAVLPQ